MVSIDSLLVVVVSTLAGGFNRTTGVIPDTASGNFTATGEGSCGASAKWGECHRLDAMIHPLHLLLPWVVTLCTVVTLGMPSVLLHSKGQEDGLRFFAGNLFQFFGLLSCSTLVSDHPSVCYALTLHSCVRLLDQHVFLFSWGWFLQRLGVALLLLLQLIEGPAVSVVHWPGGTPATLPCAYLCHLVGCVAPDLVLSVMRWLVTSARYIHIHED
jgi:hypothetical protein